MKRVLAAEPAEFVHFQSVRIILLVLFGVVIALLALGADERNLDSCFICHSFWYLPFQKIRFCDVQPHKDPCTSLYTGQHSVPDIRIDPKLGAFEQHKKALSAEVALVYHISKGLSIDIFHIFVFFQKTSFKIATKKQAESAFDALSTAFVCRTLIRTVSQ